MEPQWVFSATIISSSLIFSAVHHHSCQIWRGWKKLKGAEQQSRKPHSSPSAFSCELTSKHSPPPTPLFSLWDYHFSARDKTVKNQGRKENKWSGCQFNMLSNCCCDQVDLSQKSYLFRFQIWMQRYLVEVMSGFGLKKIQSIYFGNICWQAVKFQNYFYH